MPNCSASGLAHALAVRADLAENLVEAGPAKVAVDEQNAMTLLGEGERVIRAREALALVRQRAREKKNFAFGFGPEQREAGAQIAECFRRGTFRRFGDKAITGGAGRRAALFRRGRPIPPAKFPE